MWWLAAEYKQKIKHHFIHNLSVTNSYNAGKFEIDALLTIEQLHQLLTKAVAGEDYEAAAKIRDEISKR